MPPRDALAHWQILRDKLQQLHWEVVTHMQTLQQRGVPAQGLQDLGATSGASADLVVLPDTGAKRSGATELLPGPGDPHLAPADVAPVGSGRSGAAVAGGSPTDPRPAPLQPAEQEGAEIRRHALLQKIAVRQRSPGLKDGPLEFLHLDVAPSNPAGSD